jgi:hypothetical protein
MRSTPGETGFTAVLCTAPGCGPGDEATVAGRLVDALRAVVRESGHGVLVSTGCLLGRSACALRATSPVVVVQPCDAERRPTAGAVRVGPLRTAADVDVLGSWLRAGRLDPHLLPAHLLDLHRRAAAAPLN